MASTAEKVAFIEKGFAYEVSMLMFTRAELERTGRGLLWNVLYESYLVHARLCREFLNNDDGNTNFRAKDFDDQFKLKKDPDVDRLFSQRFNPDIFHAGKNRPERPDEKTNFDDVNRSYEWLIGELHRFINRLTHDFREAWARASSPKPPVELANSPSTTSIPSFFIGTNLDPLEADPKNVRGEGQVQIIQTGA